MEGVNNLFPNSINDVFSWSLFEKLSICRPYIPIIGCSPYNPKLYTAWHVKPESVYPHTSKYRLLRAIVDNDINEVKKVLDKGLFGVDQVLEEKYGTTPLTLASWFNRAAIMKYLILRGAEIDFFDKKGNTALMLAVKNVNYLAIGLLIENGADIKIKDKFGMDVIEKSKIRGFESLRNYLERKTKERDEIIKKSIANGRKKHWDLPKFDVKFSFEEKDEIYEKLVKDKKFFRSKPMVYPFNDLNGAYFVSFVQNEEQEKK